MIRYFLLMMNAHKEGGFSCEKKIVMELPIFGWLALLQSRKYAESNAKLFSAAGVAKLLECN